LYGTNVKPKNAGVIALSSSELRTKIQNKHQHKQKTKWEHQADQDLDRYNTGQEREPASFYLELTGVP
jgi:hypothetical protein